MDGGTRRSKSSEWPAPTLSTATAETIHLTAAAVPTVSTAAAGIDLVLYTSNTTPVRIDLVAGTASFPGQTFPAETLVSIENAQTGSGNDILVGSAVANEFYGNAGNDSFAGGGGNDSLYGGDGNDTFDGGGGTDYADGGAGSDTILFTTNTSSVRIDLVNQAVTFPGTTFAGESFSGIENASTGSGADSLFGNTSSNELRGGAGADRMNGFEAADQLVGGLGNDTFVFTAAAHSLGTSRDTIAAGDGAIAFEGAGAAAGDKIDLSAIDADTTKAGDQAFAWGTATGKAKLWAVNSGNVTLIRGNTDNDAAVEIEIAIADAGVLANKYVAGDFIL